LLKAKNQQEAVQPLELSEKSSSEKTQEKCLVQEIKSVQHEPVYQIKQTIHERILFIYLPDAVCFFKINF
jgi:hypothetical protein